MKLRNLPDKHEVGPVCARGSGSTRLAAIAVTYAALCLCFTATTVADTWTGTVVNGYSYQDSKLGKLTGRPALTNVQTLDDAGALALANAWAKKGDSITNKSSFSVFFTSDFPASDVSIDSATIRVDYGGTNTGNFVTYLSTNKSVTGWWTGSNTASALLFATNSDIVAYPSGTDTNYLWNVTSTLDSVTKITNCEVLVVNKTNSAASVLYLGYFQLEVVYTLTGAPLVTNDVGASLILTNSARLNGRVIAGGPAPQTWFYWGTNDSGPVATGWSFTNDMGIQPYGSYFSNDITGLIAGQKYYYRCSATNIHGTNWDVNPAVFTTLQTRAEFSVTASNGLESATSPVFLPVRLASTSAVPVSITYSVIGGTATAADFSLTNNTLVIPAGSIAGNIGIVITNDTIYESNETIVVAITGVTGASPGINTQCTYTIMNDDSPPLISFANQPYRPLESSTNAVISVALSQVAGMPVSVDYETWAGTASNILDYTNVSGTLSWPVGDQSTKTILVPLVNDNLQEGSETFYVGLSNAINCSISGMSSSVVTIVDDDLGAPVLYNGQPSNVTSNSATLNVDISSTGGAPTSVWIYWGLQDQNTNRSAWATNQYLGVRDIGSSSTNIPGLTTNTQYWYRCYASNANGWAWAPDSTNFLTGPPMVQFASTTLSGLESSTPVILDLRLSQPSTYGLPVSVNYAVTGGTASNGVGRDYILTNGTATIAAGSAYTNISITVFDDNIYEYDETIIVSITGVSNAVAGPNTNCVYTIIDNDPPPTVAFAITNSTVMENGGSITIPVVLSTNTERIVSIHYETGNGTAYAGSEYTATNGTFTWQPGQSGTNSFTVPIIDNTAQGGNKFFRLILTNAVNCTIIGDNTTNVVIKEDDNVAPIVTNRGASNVLWTVATLNGFMTTSYPPATAYIYWGPTDGVTDKLAWSNEINMGTTPGLFSAGLAGLVANKKYYFRCFATNSLEPASFDWADVTAVFTTAPPVVAGVSNYYVNDGSKADDLYCSATGSVANTGITTNSPKASIQAILDTYDLTPGSVIWIDTGLYTLSSSVSITNDDAGSAASNVVLRGTTGPQGSILDLNGGSSAVVRLDTGTDYVRIESLSLTGSGDSDGLYALNCAGIQVVGCKAYSNSLATPQYMAGIHFDGCSSPVVSNTLSFDNFCYGIWLNNSPNGKLRGNECYGNAGGIYIDSSAGPAVASNVVHDQRAYGAPLSCGIWIRECGAETISSNLCYSNPETGIWLEGGTSSLASGNTCWSNGVYGLYLQASDLVASGNISYANNYDGLSASGSGSSTVQRNLLYNNSGYQLFMDDLSDASMIENNSLYGANGMYLRNPALVTNRNNIICSTGSGNAAICLENSPGGGDILDSDYNTVHCSDGASAGEVAGYFYNNLTDWTNAMALDLHSIDADPGFVDALNATDFHLQSPAGSYHAGTWQGDPLYSPCIDAGDPWCTFTNETYYNGLTINQGCYGNTPEASRTVYSGPFFAVSLTTNPVRAGSAQAWPPAASCPVNGQYPTNRLITVWAVVTNQGYLWAGWSGSLTNTDTQAVFSATGIMSVVATFTSKLYTVTATGYTGGSISPSGTVSVLWGSNTAFSVSSSAGYTISNVVVDSVSKGVTNSWIFTNVTANHSIEAWFQSSSPTITAAAGPGGSIAPSGSVTVVSGTDKTFAISNNAGYTISNVVVDSVSKGVTNSWIFTNVTANHSIEAWFKPAFTTNGTPLSWLQSYGYTGDAAVADWSDEDMDKSYAWQEYQAGTVPTNSQSVFKVLRLVRTPASNLVSWYATTNSGVRTLMTVYRSTNLRYSSWIPWASNIARSFSGTNDWWDTNPPAAGIPVFYRPSLTNQAW